jgi:signal transduction histidine kinase
VRRDGNAMGGDDQRLAPDVLRGGGEMGALMRSHDWSTSSLGPPASWPQSLRTVVRLMLNTGHPMYIWWGQELACLYNDAYRESIGPERHPGSLGLPARVVWEEIWSIIGPQIDQVMTGGGATWQVNHLVPITRHGRREDVYWTYSYSPIDESTAPGGIGGILVVCTETTQQILMARRLALERDQLSQLFEQAPTFMAMLRGPEHRFELANPSYLQLIGHRPILGRTVAEALPEVVEQGYVGLLDEVFASGRAYVAKGAKYAVQVSPDGPVTERYVDFVYQPIKDREGAVAGIFVEGADVTERLQATFDLQASEQRFRNIAAKLSDASRLKDEFLATLAHELRNPLAPIRNAVDLLKIAPSDHSVASAARETLERQLAQMVRLIDDLLDLSRVNRGIVELRRDRLDLAAALRNALETSRPLIEQRGHTLTVTLPGEEFLVEADATRIVQIFANLLNNAAKFTPRGGRIELTLSRQDDETVAVVVGDNGIGIPPAKLEAIFDMFAQVDRSHEQVGGGLGIGLTIVRRLVEMHGGSIEAHSDGPGLGSEFKVSLPLLLKPPHLLPAAGVAIAPQPSTAAGRRVLVADDNVDAAESLSLLLTLKGHQTRTAHDGEEAFAVAREFRPDAMILDVAMPKLNGHDLARRIRAEDWGSETLLIAASGWGQQEDKQRSRDAGFDVHLVKPVEYEVLERLLSSPVGST